MLNWEHKLTFYKMLSATIVHEKSILMLCKLSLLRLHNRNGRYLSEASLIKI